MIQKLKQWFMPRTHKEYFNKYASYFPTVNKQLKLGRAGAINVIDKNTGTTEVYSNWDELNSVYKQFPVESVETPKVETTKAIGPTTVKYWVKGHPTRHKELAQFFVDKYGVNNSFSSNNFNKSGWVYYVDTKGGLVSTSNDIVIELLQNSSDWVEYVLPEPKKYTKAQIAELLGWDVNSFEII
jgi:hypothetical protein